jgi:hypothetical protein
MPSSSSSTACFVLGFAFDLPLAFAAAFFSATILDRRTATRGPRGADGLHLAEIRLEVAVLGWALQESLPVTVAALILDVLFDKFLGGPIVLITFEDGVPFACLGHRESRIS